MKKAIISAISGFLLVLAFPPFGAGWLAWFALVPLLFSLEGVGLKKGLLYGFIFGAAFFLGTVYWVVHSMYYYGGVPFGVGVLAMLLLVVYLSLYPAAFGLLASLASTSRPSARLVLVPVFWTAVEYLRGHLFTGLPWVLAGYSQTAYLPVIQVADITGVWGVSFLVVFVNSALWITARRFLYKDGSTRVIVPVAALAAVVLVLAYGFLRIWQVDEDVKHWSGLRAAVAQGSIDQSVKWDKSFQDVTLDIYRDLSLKASRDGARLIVWPETAVPFYFNADKVKDGKLGSITREAGSYVLTGSPSYNYNLMTGKVMYYNSAYLLSPSGDEAGRYDKFHLVPFGEYVPLKKFFPFFRKLTEGVGDFSEGPGAVPIRFEHGGIGTLICYESIFPEIASASVRNGSTILVNITNDAWFGRTSAPYQHFDMAVFRAVENRVFLLRAANTGISAIIGPAGRVRKQAGLFEKAVLVDDVGLRDGALTVYSMYGDIFAWACLAGTGVFIIKRFKRRR